MEDVNINIQTAEGENEAPLVRRRYDRTAERSGPGSRAREISVMSLRRERKNCKSQTLDASTVNIGSAVNYSSRYVQHVNTQ